jgi:Flp pilus assembly protein TadD
VDAINGGDLETAWTNLSALTAETPKDSEVWNNLGLVARKKGDGAKARSAYQTALTLNPAAVETMNNLAVLEMAEGRDAEARTLLQKALQLAPAYPEANFHLGVLEDRTGNAQAAETAYKQFLEVGSTFPVEVVEAVRDRVMEIEPR